MLQVWIQNLCINEHMQGKVHFSVLFPFWLQMFHLCFIFAVSSCMESRPKCKIFIHILIFDSNFISVVLFNT